MTDQTPQVISTKLDQDAINNMPNEGEHVISFLTMADLKAAEGQIMALNRNARLNSIEGPFQSVSLQLL